MNLINFIPKKIGKKEIIVTKLKDKIVINARGTGSPKQLNLNKEIEINDFLFEVIGLYFGDGLNTRNHTGNRRVAFANSNYELHLHWLKFLDLFGIKKEELFVQFSVGKNVSENKENILKYWNNITGIPKENFANISNYKRKTNDYGVLSIEFNSIIFRKIFDNIFDYSILEISKNENYISPFIKGLFAAEGSIVPRNNSIVNLSISITDYERREFVKNLLRKIGIKISYMNKSPDEVVINNYFNFKMVKELDLTTLHPDKHELFIKLFENMKYNIPQLTKLNIINVLKTKPMTRYEIAVALNRDISIIHKTLGLLEKEVKVVRVGKEKSIRKSRDIWSLANNLVSKS